MPCQDTTSWQLIQDSARGDPDSRERFANRYETLIRDYLGNRWRQSPLLAELDDAVQEIFVECFRQGGVLERVDPERKGGFRAFLFGVVRNVALRFDERRDRNRELQADSSLDPGRSAATDTSISQHMDRAWAEAIVREAVRLMAANARAKGEEAEQQVEILRLHFQDGIPIREIARRWQVELIPLHQQYTRARREFKAALKEVVYPGAKVPDDLLQREVAELTKLLHGS